MRGVAGAMARTLLHGRSQKRCQAPFGCLAPDPKIESGAGTLWVPGTRPEDRKRCRHPLGAWHQTRRSKAVPAPFGCLAPDPKIESGARHPLGAWHLRSLEEGVCVRVRWRAAAEKSELAVAVVLERVPGAGGDEHGVSGTDRLRVSVDLLPAGALEHEVDLLRDSVVVTLRRFVRLERRLGEALRRSVVELADRRAVLRDEELDAGDGSDLHGAAASASATRSCAPCSSAVKNGSASVRPLASSDTGHMPSRNPYRSRMYGCRWIDGR